MRYRRLGCRREGGKGSSISISLSFDSIRTGALLTSTPMSAWLDVEGRGLSSVWLMGKTWNMTVCLTSLPHLSIMEFLVDTENILKICAKFMCPFKTQYICGCRQVQCVPNALISFTLIKTLNYVQFYAKSNTLRSSLRLLITYTKHILLRELK